jgi:hypothetical protein
MSRTRTSALFGLLLLQLAVGCGMEPASEGDPDDGDPGTGDLTAR